MSYATEHIAATLKATREAKGLSQRALAQIAGMPQSYVSRVERGNIDLRLSSLVEIARALDLELALVPRKTVPAVQSIARTQAAWEFPPGSSATTRQLHQIHASLNQISQANPAIKELAQLQRQIRDLQHFRLQAPEIDALRKVNAAIRTLKGGTLNMDAIRKTLADLQDMRNRIAHAIPRIDTAKPAYSLDDDDHE